MEKLFKAVYIGGLVAKTILRIPHERRRRQVPKADQRVTLAERGLIAGLFLGMVVLPLIYSLTRWLDFANYRLPPGGKAAAGSAGVVLLSAAVWLFGRSHRDLGTNWSPSLEVGAEHALITLGV